MNYKDLEKSLAIMKELAVIIKDIIYMREMLDSILNGDVTTNFVMKIQKDKEMVITVDSDGDISSNDTIKRNVNMFFGGLSFSGRIINDGNEYNEKEKEVLFTLDKHIDHTISLAIIHIMISEAEEYKKDLLRRLKRFGVTDIEI